MSGYYGNQLRGIGNKLGATAAGVLSALLAAAL